MLKSWNIQNLTALFNPAGMARIREGDRRHHLFGPALSGTRRQCEEELPRPQTHSTARPSHLTGRFLTSLPTPSLLWVPSYNPPRTPLSHKKHTLLHLLTYLQLHSSTESHVHAGDTIFFCSSLLFPFLCFAPGKLLTVIVCCVCSFLSFVVARLPIHAFAHLHTHMHNIFFFFSYFANKIIPCETPTEETSKIQKLPDLLMKVSHPFLQWSSSSFV